VVITSYPLLFRDLPHYAGREFHALILDEAQVFKIPGLIPSSCTICGGTRQSNSRLLTGPEHGAASVLSEQELREILMI